MLLNSQIWKFIFGMLLIKLSRRLKHLLAIWLPSNCNCTVVFWNKRVFINLNKFFKISISIENQFKFHLHYLFDQFTIMIQRLLIVRKFYTQVDFLHSRRLDALPSLLMFCFAKQNLLNVMFSFDSPQMFSFTKTKGHQILFRNIREYSTKFQT